MKKVRATLLVSSLCLSYIAAAGTPVGLVLSGGGAKGAYEVGVWKALTEIGIARDVKVISGTSVGGLNAALFASVGDPAIVESFWIDSMGKIVTEVNRDKAHDALQAGMDEASRLLREQDEFRKRLLDEALTQWKCSEESELLPSVQKDIEERTQEYFRKAGIDSFVKAATNKVNGVMNSPETSKGWIDPSSLRNVLEEKLPRDWKSIGTTVYATALEKDTWSKCVFTLNREEPFARKVDILRATCAIPEVFDNVELDGHVYVDGGWTEKGGENVPISPIVERHPDIRTIYVVYLNNTKLLGNERIDASKYLGKKIIEIIPSQNLYGWFGALDFDVERGRKLMDLGYEDAMKSIPRIP